MYIEFKNLKLSYLVRVRWSISIKNTYFYRSNTKKYQYVVLITQCNNVFINIFISFIVIEHTIIEKAKSLVQPFIIDNNK